MLLFLSRLIDPDERDERGNLGTYNTAELKKLINALSKDEWELISDVANELGWRGARWKKGNEYITFQGDGNGNYVVKYYGPKMWIS